jgi:hypothetical protein
MVDRDSRRLKQVVMTQFFTLKTRIRRATITISLEASVQDQLGVAQSGLENRVWMLWSKMATGGSGWRRDRDGRDRMGRRLGRSGCARRIAEGTV